MEGLEIEETKFESKISRRAKELVNVDAPNLWNTFKSVMLQACDEVCGRKKGSRNHGNTWWWHEEVKEVMRQKKVAYKKMCENRFEKNKARYKNIKN